MQVIFFSWNITFSIRTFSNDTFDRRFLYGYQFHSDDFDSNSNLPLRLENVFQETTDFRTEL